ncbi:hypothetical protein GCM10023146_43900 [Nocardioides caricicola]
MVASQLALAPLAMNATSARTEKIVRHRVRYVLTAPRSSPSAVTGRAVGLTRPGPPAGMSRRHRATVWVRPERSSRPLARVLAVLAVFPFVGVDELYRLVRRTRS